MIIAVLVIKNQDQKNLILNTETNSILDPLDPSVLNAQNTIVADRENKLRQLNGTPQTLQTKEVTTTTNTAVSTPTPSASKSSSRTTKKS